MSTNYYLDSPDNEAGHLGKYSGGWAFTAKAPAGVDSFAQWIGQTEGHQIVAEHGLEESLGDFLAMVLDSRKGGHQRMPQREKGEFVDQGILFVRYDFC